MKKRSNRKKSQRGRNPTLVWMVNRLSETARRFHVLRVELTEHDIVLVSKDTDGLICRKSYPKKLWMLRDDGDEPGTATVPLESSRAVLSPSPSSAEDPDDFFEEDDGEEPPAPAFTPPVRTARPLGIDETGPGEYNARDPKNWEKPKHKVNWSQHINTNIAQQEGERISNVFARRQTLLKRTEILGAGFTLDRPTGGN